MNYDEHGTREERKIAHPGVHRVAASAHFVPAQGMQAQGNSLSPHPRPLSTAFHARSTMPLQVTEAPCPCKLPQQYASANIYTEAPCLCNYRSTMLLQ